MGVNDEEVPGMLSFAVFFSSDSPGSGGILNFPVPPMLPMEGKITETGGFDVISHLVVDRAGWQRDVPPNYEVVAFPDNFRIRFQSDVPQPPTWAMLALGLV